MINMICFCNLCDWICRIFCHHDLPILACCLRFAFSIENVIVRFLCFRFDRYDCSIFSSNRSMGLHSRVRIVFDTWIFLNIDIGTDYSYKSLASVGFAISSANEVIVEFLEDGKFDALFEFGCVRSA